jgi:hypothetical protein
MVTAVDPPGEPQFAPVNTITNNSGKIACNYLNEWMRFVFLVNVDEPLTEEQRDERAAVRNNNARRQLIPRSDVPQTEGRRESARYVVERSNSPVVEEEDDESKFDLH